MDSRARNRWVVIQQHTGETDEANQPLPDAWEEFVAVYANIRPQTGAESIRADHDTSAAKVSIRIGYRINVTNAMRVVHAGTVYEIKSVLPDVAGRQHTDLVCEVVSA